MDTALKWDTCNYSVDVEQSQNKESRFSLSQYIQGPHVWNIPLAGIQCGSISASNPTPFFKITSYMKAILLSTLKDSRQILFNIPNLGEFSPLKN